MIEYGRFNFVSPVLGQMFLIPERWTENAVGVAFDIELEDDSIIPVFVPWANISFVGLEDF